MGKVRTFPDNASLAVFAFGCYVVEAGQGVSPVAWTAMAKRAVMSDSVLMILLPCFGGAVLAGLRIRGEINESS